MSGEREACSFCKATWGERHFNPCEHAGHWYGKSVVEGLRAELERTKAERNAEHVKTNRALLRVGEAEGIIRRLVGYVADDGSEGNGAVLGEAEGFLGGVGERP